MARISEPTTDTAWVDDIVTLAQSVTTGDRCNAAAVAAGRLELTYPSTDAVTAYMADPDALIVISHDGPALIGYLIVVDDDKLGGCQGRWVGLTGSPPTRVAVAKEMLDVAVAAYGWVWGRVTNAGVRQALDSGIAEGAIAPEDPEIITYKRPT